MPAVVPPPLSAARRIRKLNGVIAHHSHPAVLSVLANSLHGRVMRGAYAIPISDAANGMVDKSEVEIAVPMWGDADGVKIDVLAYNSTQAGQDVSFVSDADAVGVSVHVDNYLGVAATMARATWFTTGFETGDTASQVPRLLAMTAGGDGAGFEKLTYTGHADVTVYGIRLTYVRVRNL